ncbi:olfactory receptor 2A12-like [Leptodactylus fuscus]|uniref:olfactory receptor 2A12-like n=1 Tax=Leptodactylus fuscus TaxID=238119 RepID=UPI003F4E50A5
MGMDNLTTPTEFILLGFTDDPTISLVLFLIFLIIYIITVVGNLLIICIILANHRLHIPMYFFLCILAFLDLCNSSSVVPKFLLDLLSVCRIISASLCGMQIFVILFLGGTECQLLALMAYDRYVAICRPLHYPVVMRWSVCFHLTAFVWIFSFMICVIPSVFTPMPLCYPNLINHFMCEILAIVKLACGDIRLTSVMKIKSAGRSKAFSTCSSHITVVALFFGTGMSMYFGPSSEYSSDREKYLSIFYLIISPIEQKPCPSSYQQNAISKPDHLGPKSKKSALRTSMIQKLSPPPLKRAVSNIVHPEMLHQEQTRPKT